MRFIIAALVLIASALTFSSCIECSFDHEPPDASTPAPSCGPTGELGGRWTACDAYIVVEPHPVVDASVP